jgi:hypothetical protein
MTGTPLSDYNRLPPRLLHVGTVRGSGCTAEQGTPASRQTQISAIRDGTVAHMRQILDVDEWRRGGEKIKGLWAGSCDNDENLLDGGKKPAGRDQGAAYEPRCPSVIRSPIHARPIRRNRRKAQVARMDLKGLPQEDVQARPYCLDPPRSAPQARHNSK